ncbi:MAG: hypothetical protein NTW49_05980 [Bacteroidia bacterium]|nr:hypothetical protein [Bacteroidia bacterium]
MTDPVKSIESLYERAADYGKTSYELLKLKALDKTSDAVSSIVPHTFVIILIATFMLFLNLGLAFLLGEILGRIYFGFFVVAGFYGITGIIIHFFMHKWIKKHFRDYFIQKTLK